MAGSVFRLRIECQVLGHDKSLAAAHAQAHCGPERALPSILIRTWMAVDGAKFVTAFGALYNAACIRARTEANLG